MSRLQRDASAPLYPTVIGSPLVLPAQNGGSAVMLREIDPGGLVMDAVFAATERVPQPGERTHRVIVQVRRNVVLRMSGPRAADPAP